ncbi:MAG: hypothetical protein CO119_11560 [Flavobacteriales bacterium CG_4_9_14_3_um_filter_40_17]|nr:MAG: hypothetical protein CO119_11560 [Flavobacteriales bacterium CG_4_9_14_3_um_filter_40_17]
MITTEYAGNFVYENGVLKQISHKEGYLEPKTGGGYQYVYRMADIWGNTRITYADDNGDGTVTSAEIRREQNYYPFGLEQRGYNNSISGPKNNLKTYQGQEFTDDLNLNTHEWKFRVSDPAIGRFWQIDPLSEDYYYNSTYAFQENKLGMGVELEGKEIFTWIQQKLINNASENPNGVSAHVLGIAQGLGNTAKGLVNAVTNPKETLKGAANLLVAAASQGNPSNMLAADNAIGTNSLGAATSMVETVEQATNDVINGNGIERGTVIGEVIGAVAGTKGANVATKAVVTAIKANKSVGVFRVFGGDSGLFGKSFTPVNPNTVSDFRNVAGLPTGGVFGTNTARFMIEGTVKEKNILLRRNALPMDGNNGGLPEIVVKDASKVKITRVSGINPEF